MYLLRVAQKVLFICNLCWLGGWAFRLLPLEHWPDFASKTMLVLGWILAEPLGIVWYGTFLLLVYARKMRFASCSRVLFVVNAVFLVAIAVTRMIM